jgi:hypothetical protein
VSETVFALDVNSFSEVDPSAKKTTNMANPTAPVSAPLPNLIEYFETGDFADFTINFGDSKVKAHRIILSVHSKFFDKACRRLFKEVEEQEVALTIGEEYLLRDMIAFMYHGDFLTHAHENGAECKCQTGRLNEPKYYAEMYHLAGKCPHWLNLKASTNSS